MKREVILQNWSIFRSLFMVITFLLLAKTFFVEPFLRISEFLTLVAVGFILSLVFLVFIIIVNFPRLKHLPFWLRGGLVTLGSTLLISVALFFVPGSGHPPIPAIIIILFPLMVLFDEVINDSFFWTIFLGILFYFLVGVVLGFLISFFKKVVLPRLKLIPWFWWGLYALVWWYVVILVVIILNNTFNYAPYYFAQITYFLALPGIFLLHSFKIYFWWAVQIINSLFYFIFGILSWFIYHQIKRWKFR